MAKFLNTDLLNEWIPRLIQESERELIIIVPYIKTSERIFTHLYEANKRGVETTLVFRENKLNDKEYNKLSSLDNLNLFCHPNVHAKCYYNEKYLIITSINLYEYSEKNNREMGVLFHRVPIGKSLIGAIDDPMLFEDAIKEINTIIKSSELKRRSRETQTLGFAMEIIKTEKEKTEEFCKALNKIFIHKKFEAVANGSNWIAMCHNYFDRIDVSMDHRAAFTFQFDEERVQAIFKKFVPHYHEYRFDGFKFYWNHPKGSIYLYKDSRNVMWQSDKDIDAEINGMKNGIDQTISFMRQFIEG